MTAIYLFGNVDSPFDFQMEGEVFSHGKGLRQPLSEQRVPFLGLVVSDGDPQGLAGADDHHELLASGDGRVEEVALEEHVVLGDEGEDHSRVLVSL